MTSFFAPPDAHFQLIKEERAVAASDEASARRAMVVVERVMQAPVTDLGGDIDWEKELSAFGKLPYPKYYTQPFHSIPGGWLSKKAALMNRMAMQAIYQESHPHSCMGLRDVLANLVPDDARLVVDLGSGDCDGPAAVAKKRPRARVVALDASPFMLVVGRRQNRGLANLEFMHALAEDTKLPSGEADAVTITLVLHECDDGAKTAILKEACRLLRPGGVLVFADTPPDELQTFRGFYEPWREQWAKFEGAKFFGQFSELREVKDHGILGRKRGLTAEEHKANAGQQTVESRLFCVTARKKVGPPARL